MRDALHEALRAVRDDPEVRVLLLEGSGRAFSTGGDLTEFGTAPSPVGARQARWRRDVWGVLWSLPQITVAAVHGLAVGGGFEMAMLCDQCWAAVDARFALPETGLGMIPGVAGTQTLPRLVGLGRAIDLVLTGRWLDARRGARAGNRGAGRGRAAPFGGAALREPGALAALDPGIVGRLEALRERRARRCAGAKVCALERRLWRIEAPLLPDPLQQRNLCCRTRARWTNRVLCSGADVNTCNFVGIPAQMFADQEILVFEGNRLTYGELWERHPAARARACAGSASGAATASRVLQTNSDRYVEAYFASAAAGAVVRAAQLPRQAARARVHDRRRRTKVLLVGDRYARRGRRAAPAPAERVQTYVALESQQTACCTSTS